MAQRATKGVSVMNKSGIVVLGVAAVGALVLFAGSSKAAPSPQPQPTPGPTPPGKLNIVVNPIQPIQPTPTPPTPPTPGTPQTARQTAAFNVSAAIGGNGYRQSDQAIYSAYQAAAGLTADGFPGTNTMNALASDLQSFGQAWPFVDGFTGDNVVVYPWLSTGNYDGTNAPPAAEWNR
jgi:hypothetical protein